MMKIPTKCPICKEDTYVESVRCTHCATAISNKFEISAFSKLTDAQTDFILTFLGVEGNIKEMEKALGISYPTVKSRLAEIQQALGLAQKSQTSKQFSVLQQIERGEISVEAALEILKKGDKQ